MKAVVFQSIGKIEVIDVPKPRIQTPEDAIVRVTTAAICGSNLHVLHGHTPAEPGTILGHEFVGIVDEVGVAVTNVKPGDRVLSLAGTNCGRCELCKEKKITVCPNGGIYGDGPVFGNLPGAHAEYVRTLFANEALFKIPDNLEDEQIIWAGDILPTAYTGFTGFTPEGKGLMPGKIVAVFGAGPVGLASVQVARLFSAVKIIVVDTIDNRLDVAMKMGADHVINSSKEDPVDAIMNLTHGKGVEFVVEASGHPAALKHAQAVSSWGSTVCILGIHFQPQEIDFIELVKKNGHISAGICNAIYTNELIGLIESGRVDLTPMITHRFPLSEAVKAYEVFEKKIDGAIKVILKP